MLDTINVRVSTLEAFRRVQQTDYGNESDLIDRIRNGQWRKDKADQEDYLTIGTAWHSILARAFKENHALHGYESLGYLFNGKDVEEALIHVGQGTPEVTGFKTIKVGPFLVTVLGTCDLINGLYICDYKTKKDSQPDARDYELSLQWRFYLHLFECDKFTYHLFKFNEDRKDKKHLILRDVTSFSFWRYKELENDCQLWVEKFCDWADMKGLIESLSIDNPTRK